MQSYKIALFTLLLISVEGQTSATISGFNFEADAAGSCPKYWTCGDTSITRVQQMGNGRCANLAGCWTSDGQHLFEVASDLTQGWAKSYDFIVPSNAVRMQFLRGGGADNPSGVFVNLSNGGGQVCGSHRGDDTDTLFEDWCDISAARGQSVYIYLSDQTNSGWGKVYVDNIRVQDANGNNLPFVISTSPKKAVLKECRWESNHDQNPNSADYMGWTCANDEILTGFGLSADQHDVTKVQCCKVGGHSSIKTNTCTYIESNHERAKCGHGNDHMVFSGAYDKRAAANDAVTEILAGKCCEVECDAAWCAGGDWGVDKNNCQVISTAGTSAQELVCPTGTIMTEIEDGLAGNAHGVQKVASVTCCALDIVAPPTIAPSAAPSTARPTSAPTKAPSTSMPSIAPTTMDDCLLALKDSSQLTDSQYLSNIDLCLPGCRSPRRALESRLLSEMNRRQ